MQTIETRTHKGYDIEIYADYDACTWMWEDLQGQDYIVCTYGNSDYGTEGIGSLTSYIDDNFTPYQIYLTLGLEYRDMLKGYAKEQGEGVREYIKGWSIEDFASDVYGYGDEKLLLEMCLDALNSRKGIDFTKGGLRGVCQGEYLECIVVGTWKGSKSKTQFDYVQAIFAGDVVGYVWEHGGCGGFVDDDKYMMEEVRDEIDFHIASEQKKHNEQVKGYIKSGVNPIYRKALIV